MVNRDRPNRRIMAYGLLAVYVTTVGAAYVGITLANRYVEMIETVTLWVVAIYIGAKAVKNLPRLQELVSKRKDRDNG